MRRSIMTDVVKVGEKGQITIPKKIREKEGLKKGESLEVKDLGEGTILLTSVNKKKESDYLLNFNDDESDLKETEDEARKFIKELKKAIESYE